MGTQPRNNETLCVYGGTEMTSHNELRDRIAEVIDHALRTWMNDSKIEGTEQAFAAQAIIDEFGMSVETGHITGQGYGLPGVIGKRVVGKWEKQWTGTRKHTNTLRQGVGNTSGTCQNRCSNTERNGSATNSAPTKPWRA